MKNDFFPQAVVTMFSVMITMLIALVVMTSCNDTSTFREGRSVDSLSATLQLTVSDYDTLDDINKKMEVCINKGNIDTIIISDSLHSEMTAFHKNVNNTVVAFYGDNSHGIMNTIESETIIETGENVWPVAYRSIHYHNNQSVSGDVKFFVNPSGELQKVTISRTNYHGIVKNCKAEIEFDYDDESNLNSVPMNLRYARFHPEVINSLALSSGLGEYVATKAFIIAKHNLRGINVKYAIEDPIAPGRIQIEYNGMKVRTSHNNPGSFIMGGSVGSWRVSIFSYYPW